MQMLRAGPSKIDRLKTRDSPCCVDGPRRARFSRGSGVGLEPDLQLANSPAVVFRARQHRNEIHNLRLLFVRRVELD
jgi:hypothetical protein